MRFFNVGFTAIVMAIAALTAAVESLGQEPRSSNDDQDLQVILLGTAGGGRDFRRTARHQYLGGRRIGAVAV